MADNKCGVTFRKVTALLCTLVILAGLVASFGSGLSAEIKYLNAQIKHKNELIEQEEAQIEELEQDISRYQEEKQEKEQDLAKVMVEQEAAIKDLEEKAEALEQAEKALDEVCTRSSYSSWWCSSKCRGLHAAVANRTTELNNAKKALSYYETLQNDINDLTDNIAQAEGSIEAARENIDELKVVRKVIRSKLVGAWFKLIFILLATLLAMGGLGLLVKIFYTGEQHELTVFATAGLAASSLLFLIIGANNNARFENAPLAYLLLNLHTWNLAVMALFAAILLKKTDKPVVLRNIAVVLAVILALLAVINTSFVGLLYAAAMICTAFVLVPLVFTEYIDIAKHIFLSLITFGIWQLVWIYHITKNLNSVESVEQRKPARELLLCMFLAFYHPYWLYKTAEGVEDYGKEKNREFKIDVLCIAFSFVCPLFATVLIQNKINVVVGKPVCTKAEIPEAPEQEEVTAETESVDNP